jgi:hypothetical protein
MKVNITQRLLLPKSGDAYMLSEYAQPQAPQHSMVSFHIVCPHSSGGTRAPELLSLEPALLLTGGSKTTL